MWFTSLPNAFICPEDNSNPEPVLFSAIFFKVFLPCLLWGAGTAFGEVPPYALSRAARLAGQRNAEFDELHEATSKYDLFNRMKVWMINFLQKHGFWGVILMSAWPNMAFDLCGICCGHFLMPFSTFISATLIGKALIKVNLQAMFFITLFSKKHLADFVAGVERIIPDEYDPCVMLASKECHNLLNDLLLEAKANFHRQIHEVSAEAEISLIKRLWGFIMFTLIGFFVLSCIEQFAQQKQANLDELETYENEKLKKN